MKRWFGNMKFRTKIILVCVVTLLLNSLLVGVLYYDYVFKDTLKNFYSTSEDVSTQMNSHMAERFRTITTRVYDLNSNISVYYPLRTYMEEPTSVNHAKLLGVMAENVSSIRSTDNYINSVYVHTSSGGFDDFLKIRHHDFVFEESEFYEYFLDKPDVTIAWFPAQKNPVFVGNEYVIPVVYKFKIDRRMDVYFVVFLDQRGISDYLKNTYASYEKIFIVDRDGNDIADFGEAERGILMVLGSADLGSQKSVCKEVTYQGETYLATYTEMKLNGWQFYSLRSAESLTGNLAAVRYFIMAVLIVCTLLGIVTSIIFAHNITTPLNKLMCIMNKAVKKEFHIQFDYPYEDEVGNLSKSFNYMIREIDHLITELNIHIKALEAEKENVKRVETQKRKAELKALQAQINPHFLYNTLNAITWQAADQGAKEISILSNSLGKFFRVSLSRGREIITIKEELEHITSYLNIQKIRYKTKIHFDISAPKEVLNCYVVKLVLQPLVENSIYHGIKGSDKSGYIKVTVEQQEEYEGIPAIRICVEDNGLGIEEQLLKRMNEGLSQGVIDRNTGYGIFNVNERIKLYYGDAYGLFYESKYQEWTKAILIVPVQTTEGE